MFEDLKSAWKNQHNIDPPENGSQKIVEKVRFMKNKQRITNGVLAITFLVLVGFFFYISAYRYTQVMLLLLTMIGAVLLRIGIEVYSLSNLKKLDSTVHMGEFFIKLKRYYTQRLKVHYVATPLILIIYSIAFVGLLPYFKESLSSGFYTYIQISSVMVLIVLSFFIGLQIRKELRLLRTLKNEEPILDKNEENIS